jgi:hypothetical protein
MDGVQADFFTAWARLHGKQRYKEIGDRAAREASILDLNARGPEFVYEFFRDLQPLPGGQKLIGWLRQNHIPFTVLSAPLRENREASIAGKREWLERYNPGTADSAIFTGEKFHYATQAGQPNVLVDDFKKYIGAWRKAGGMGILYRDNNVESVIAELARIYGVDQAVTEEQLQEYSYIDTGIHEVLERKGFRFLGQGADQAAYLSPNGRAVLKIFGAGRGYVTSLGRKSRSRSQEMFETWVNYCQQHADNPYLPRFLAGEDGEVWRPFEFRGRRYLQIWQEHLPRANRNLNRGLSIMDDIIEEVGISKFLSGKFDATNRDHSYMDLAKRQLGPQGVQLMARTLAELHEIADIGRYRSDLHFENFRSRADGTPVIMDPWSIP